MNPQEVDGNGIRNCILTQTIITCYKLQHYKDVRSSQLVLCFLDFEERKKLIYFLDQESNHHFMTVFILLDSDRNGDQGLLRTNDHTLLLKDPT